MSDHHGSREQTAAFSIISIDKSIKDESNDAGGVSFSSSSFPSFNSLPMDILVLIFEYIPQYPRLSVVKFVSKRFHSAVMRSFSSISSLDFPWNWKFVLQRFTSIISLDISLADPSRDTSLSLPHLVKLELLLREFSSSDALQCFNKFLVVAPRLRRARIVLGDTTESMIVSFLQAAERAGVWSESTFLIVQKKSCSNHSSGLDARAVSLLIRKNRSNNKKKILYMMKNVISPFACGWTVIQSRVVLRAPPPQRSVFAATSTTLKANGDLEKSPYGELREELFLNFVLVKILHEYVVLWRGGDQLIINFLQVGGFRMLCHIDILAAASRNPDPQGRLIGVLRWLLSVVEKEEFHKKPYNPVLGETLRCYVELGGTAGRAEYIAEQVSHHPPIAMYIVRISSANVLLKCHTSFGVKFGYNSVNVTTEGYLEVILQNQKEVYRFSKPLPDLQVKNVILGSRRIAWLADMSLRCETTNMRAAISFKDDSKNTVEGALFKGDTEIASFHGLTGETIQLKIVGAGKTEPLVVHEGLAKLPLHYPVDQESTCSMRIWAASNRAIIDNDMDKADAAKTAVEVEQRRQKTLRETKDAPLIHQFFDYDQLKKDWEPKPAVISP